MGRRVGEARSNFVEDQWWKNNKRGGVGYWNVDEEGSGEHGDTNVGRKLKEVSLLFSLLLFWLGKRRGKRSESG